MGRLLPLQRTKLSQAEFHSVTTDAWNEVVSMGSSFVCNGMVAGILFGQYAFETGWGNSCWNGNLGNHRTGPLKPPAAFGYEGDYIELRTADEVIDGKRVIVGGYFRGYGLRDDPETPRRGALGHIEFLSKLQRYQPALNVLRATSMILVPSKQAVTIAANEFVDALKLAGYFTGELVPYRNGVASIARDYLGLPFVDDFPVIEHETIDPRNYGLPIPDQSLNSFNQMDALKMIYPEVYGDYRPSDIHTLAMVTACRYDCEEAA
jgi:hypothetical protein